MRKLLSFFGLAIFVLAVSVPQAEAAQKKRQFTKSSKSTIIAKRKVSRTFVVGTHKTASRTRIEPLRLSFGQMAGLQGTPDTLDLKSSVALVIDQDTNEVLFSKNEQAVLPIASLTKLMTGLVLREAHLSPDQMITISQDDVDTEKGSSSRLGVGTTLSRGELLHLALMSSENRAAHALARSYPGGLPVFVRLMNAKAKSIGMSDTHYVEPTGLSSKNQSSARDLAKLVNVAHGDPILRELTTSPDYQVAVGNRTLQYNNTNRLVKNPSWDIGLQKTGYISEAGRCLVMQTKIAGRKLIMVFLDSAGKLTRIGDAERVRRWVESKPAIRSASVPLASAAVDEIAAFQ
ncbi:MAG: D-alanyl-D-alanine endopeptidase [Rhodoferax sp.]|uniref:D-alanyl-D-alanine endopeptidase n=1 Tax=Rhodoferax sp. TaxID=50421 RepID=UPI0013FEF667|nr:D-alanyl-D-alanine endopeptidase [Rhodoferax sp.]NDP38466.1 D-alanyl-D-alanine endopeptidase [Rhodoferax sp.]